MAGAHWPLLSPQTDPTAQSAGAASEPQEQIRTHLQVRGGAPGWHSLRVGCLRPTEGPCCPHDLGRGRQWRDAPHRLGTAWSRWSALPGGPPVGRAWQSQPLTVLSLLFEGRSHSRSPLPGQCPPVSRVCTACHQGSKGFCGALWELLCGAVCLDPCLEVMWAPKSVSCVPCESRPGAPKAGISEREVAGRETQGCLPPSLGQGPTVERATLRRLLTACVGGLVF